MSLESLITILGMAAITYAIRAGGLLLANRLPTTGFAAGAGLAGWGATRPIKTAMGPASRFKILLSPMRWCRASRRSR